MFSIAVTTTELTQDTRWVYLHPADQRLMLSPTPVKVLLPSHALIAFALAQDFFADTVPDGHGFLLTMTGPLGGFRSSYHGPKTPSISESLREKQATAVRTAESN